MAKWFLKKIEANIELMSKTLGISPVLSAILLNRGINSKNSAIKFLNPSLDDFLSPSLFKDIDKAVELIVKTAQSCGKIVIYGDYDVDGVMSVSILYKALKTYGADVSFYIPHREHEGYGLNIETIDKLHQLQTSLIITCDNGISAIDEIAYAKNLGINIIIIDHHEPGFCKNENGEEQDVLPETADAIIDPKQKSCCYPFKSLCAAGISYKFSKYFFDCVKMEFTIDEELLILACIATVCDIVDLIDENRLIVKYALKLINDGKYLLNKGLSALIKERGLENKTIGSFEIGFVLGPCINATGRLETALISAELFTCDDAAKAAELAKKLCELNEDRKTKTLKSVEYALESLRSHEQLDKVIVLYDEAIHESIAGIVAGRIKDSLYHPTIVLTHNPSGLAKGSARSIEGYNIFEELYKCRDLFERFGGHEMAAGLSLDSENIETLRYRLNETCTLTEFDFEKTIRIDKELPLSSVTYELANELRLLEPFGKANKEPVFGTKNLTANIIETIGKDKKTLRFSFTIPQTGRVIKAVCFNKLDQFLQMLEDCYGDNKAKKFIAYGRVTDIKLDIVYNIGINEYNGNMYVEVKIIDFRLHKA